MKIVSGKTGTSHVTSEQFRQIIEGTVGQGSYILTSGENLEPELASNNMLKIRGGMMSHHGNVSCVELNTYDEVTLTNGSQGVKRIDLIVNRYTRNDETGLEKNEWVVIIGTPDATNPKVPEYIAGNLQNGDLTDDCPVFEVHYDGINVTEVKKLLPVMSNLDLLNGKISITANGICKKYNNGIMEQYIKVDRNTSAWAAWKYMYYAEVAAVDYIEPFKDITYLDIYLQSNNVAVGQMTLDNGTLAKTSSMYALRPDTANPLTVTVYVHVIGRWK